MKEWTIGVILRAELRAFRNRLLKRGAGRLVALSLALLFAGVFLVGGAFSLGAAVGRYLSVARDPILAGGFTTLSVLMLVVGFPTVIATFFVGRDLLQLILAPIRGIDIFVARALLAMSANALVSVILLAAVLGVGVGSGAGPIYYVLAVVLLINQVLVVTAFQALIMSLVLRWIPPRIARDVAAAVAGLTGAGLYLLWNVSLRQSFTGRQAPDLTNLTAFMQRIDWLPPAWPGHALNAVIADDAASALVWSVLAVGLGAVLVAAAEMLYSRTLLVGLGVFGSVPALWTRAPRRSFRAQERVGAASPTRAIARKDWLGYRRDIRRLSRLLPALIFPVGYAFAFLRPSRGGITGFWSEVLVIAFVSMFMSTALGTPSVPSERRGFQLLRMAPLSMWQVIRAKIALTLPPVIVLTLAFGVVVTVVTGGSAGLAVTLFALAVWLGAGFVSLSVSAGAIDPHFEAADDRRAVGVAGTLLGLGAALAFGALSLGAVALFQFAFGAIGRGIGVGPIPGTPGFGAAAAVLGVVVAGVAASVVAVMIVVANARLGRFEAAISEPG